MSWFRRLRVVAVLIALLVPLQFAAVAVAAYCAHEHALEQQAHFGHHNHQHDEGATHEEGVFTGHSNCELGCSLSLKVSIDWPQPLGAILGERPALASAPPIIAALPEALFRPPLARRA
jgi:hypothetical protein